MARTLITTAALIALLTRIPAEAGSTDLMAAVAGRDSAAVATQIAMGADLDSMDATGNTPMMHAAARDYTELVTLLLAAGADADVRGRIGNTALVHAVQSGAPASARLLIEAGARADVANDYGNDARSLAGAYGLRTLVRAIDAATPAVAAPGSAAMAMAH